ncbi:MAG: hypothetical protein U9R25_19120 [Chloroflexota bacterium]|nr:hypothetical protein [Chloroflexota bacterium]
MTLSLARNLRRWVTALFLVGVATLSFPMADAVSNLQGDQPIHLQNECNGSSCG